MKPKPGFIYNLDGVIVSFDGAIWEDREYHFDGMNTRSEDAGTFAKLTHIGELGKDYIEKDGEIVKESE